MAGGGPIRSHSTEVSDRRWNGSQAEAKLRDDPKALRRAHAWVDPQADPSTKSAYKFIHHEVSKDGTPGPANVRGATNGIAVLNGARGGADIPAGDRKGIYNHLARHLRDRGKDPTPLK
ncbi:MAG: hypothetical protein M3179_10365 [Actinomycetota bacterium]|nr:hypothetical protein [Actinomycetota bacterium]